MPRHSEGRSELSPKSINSIHSDLSAFGLGQPRRGLSRQMGLKDALAATHVISDHCDWPCRQPSRLVHSCPRSLRIRRDGSRRVRISIGGRPYRQSRQAMASAGGTRLATSVFFPLSRSALPVRRIIRGASGRFPPCKSESPKRSSVLALCGYVVPLPAACASVSRTLQHEELPRHSYPPDEGLVHLVVTVVHRPARC